MSKKKAKSPLKNTSTPENDEFKIQYWSLKLNCTKEELVTALVGVGISASHIHSVLSRKTKNELLNNTN